MIEWEPQRETDDGDKSGALILNWSKWAPENLRTVDGARTFKHEQYVLHSVSLFYRETHRGREGERQRGREDTHGGGGRGGGGRDREDGVRDTQRRERQGDKGSERRTETEPLIQRFACVFLSGTSSRWSCSPQWCQSGYRNIRSGEPVRVTLVYRISCSVVHASLLLLLSIVVTTTLSTSFFRCGDGIKEGTQRNQRGTQRRRHNEISGTVTKQMLTAIKYAIGTGHNKRMHSMIS